MIDPYELIGKKLKDDQVLAIISDFGLKVHYDIDVDHENMSDQYWIEDFPHGFALTCDEEQTVDCCFIYLEPKEGYSAFPWKIPGLQILDGRIPALGEPTKIGEYNGTAWVRYDGPELSIHLTCDARGPYLLTFMRTSSAP